jgi:signal transduction histidine kinase/CheY-like chemotaxis protein
MSKLVQDTPSEDLRDNVRSRVAAQMLVLSFSVGMLLAAADLARLGNLGLLLFVFSAASWGAWRRWPRLGRWLVPLVYTLLTLLALFWLDFPGRVCLLAIPAGIAALFLGTTWGLSEALGFSVLLLVGDTLLPLPDMPSRMVALLAIWAMQGFIWTAVSYASQVAEVALMRYEQMRVMLEAARDQRLLLKETQDSLSMANEELARVSERLRSMREVAEDARRAKEEFIANVSHELRTPLNMIIGFSEMITQVPHIYSLELPPRLLADIDVILRNSQHLSALVNDVLDLSQSDASRVTLSRGWVNLHEIVEEAVVAVRPLFESKNLALDYDDSADLPDVYCDRTRVRQVLLNLLSNAGRFTEKGRVDVYAHQVEETLVVSVTDTGPGISEEDQQRIFEPFEQLGSTTRALHGGSGLGLTISKRFVEMHGGRMWLESEPHKGTTFYFSLPISGLPSPSDGPPSLRRWFRPDDYYEQRTTPWRAPALDIVPRFVVVESGSALQRLLSRGDEDSEVVGFSDLEAAIHEASRVPCQGLIINNSEYESILAQREPFIKLPYGTPVIGCWWPDAQAAAERLGLMRYLIKPIKREDLLGALDDLRRPIRTILLADDEPEAMQLFGRMLASAKGDYRILRTSTGRRTLGLLRRHHPDVLLIDLVMPDMDGYSVLHEKSLDPGISEIPSIAISAQDPVHGPLAGGIAVTRSGGIYAQELLEAIGALSHVLAPPDRFRDREQPRTPSA